MLVLRLVAFTDTKTRYKQYNKKGLTNIPNEHRNKHLKTKQQQKKH